MAIMVFSRSVVKVKMSKLCRKPLQETGHSTYYCESLSLTTSEAPVSLNPSRAIPEL
jgi:hypothetical protein